MVEAGNTDEESQSSRLSRNTVLIVDDTEDGGAAIEQACVGIPGIRVTVLSSGAEAVRLLEEPGSSVCAVITDIRMPHMDGFALIEFIRSHQRHGSTPIIVVTADTDPRTPQRAASLGANAFFAKPFSPRAVRRTLEELTHAS